MKDSHEKRSSNQNKEQEIAFFDDFGSDSDYDVFTPDSSRRLITRLMSLGGFERGSRIADIGCGSGVFTRLVESDGFRTVGLDISMNLLKKARGESSHIPVVCGDAEHLPFASGSLDGALLSGLIHHLPNPERLAEELYRVMRSGGSFVAFDPNRLNPFMYLYRDRSSPFYSMKGVTRNERPVLARETKEVFQRAGFTVSIDHVSGLKYRYVESGLMKSLLPLYNTIDTVMFAPQFMKKLRAFVITHGEKN